MMKWFSLSRKLICSTALFSLILSAVSDADAPGNDPSDSSSHPWPSASLNAYKPIDGRYVAVLKRSSAAIDLERLAADIHKEHNTTHRKLFKAGIRGFSFALPKWAPREVQRRILDKLQKKPEIAYVFQDYQIKASGYRVETFTGQAVPAGIRRIGAADSSGRTAAQAADVSVAVLDSGVELSHPDLNVLDGYNCIEHGQSADDYEGHGTHCAGIIGARNNPDVGVVGVAPGTRIIAVKVLNDSGDGSAESMMCGIAWTILKAAQLNIKVMSLSVGGGNPGLRGESCATTTDGFRAAICAAAAANITIVAAAGNEGADMSQSVPALYPEVLAATAAADSDGRAGGLGANLGSCNYSHTVDDSAAVFSNYASPDDKLAMSHVIAAPGVCVFSTLCSGSYGVQSGTSMAAPHVAGAIALCHGSGGVPGPCAGMTPDQVIRYMVDTSRRHTLANPARTNGTVEAARSGNCSVGRTLRPLVNTYTDDDSIAFTLPFSFRFLGKDYGLGANGGVYVGTNSYITFGGGSKARYDLGAVRPPLPTIHIGSGDPSVKAVYGGADQLEDLSTACYTLRYEGCAWYGGCAAANIVYEITFCSANSSMSLCVVAHAGAANGTSGVSSGRDWLRSYDLAAGTSYSFSGFGAAITPGEGFVGDPVHTSSDAGRYYGYLLWAGDFLVPPNVTLTNSPGAEPPLAFDVVPPPPKPITRIVSQVQSMDPLWVACIAASAVLVMVLLVLVVLACRLRRAKHRIQMPELSVAVADAEVSGHAEAEPEHASDTAPLLVGTGRS